MPSHVRSEFLRSCSRESLQEFELSLMGRAAQTRKRITALEAVYLEEMKWAEVARLILDDPQLSSIGGHPVQETLDFIGGAGPQLAPREAPANRVIRHAAD